MTLRAVCACFVYGGAGSSGTVSEGRQRTPRCSSTVNGHKYEINSLVSKTALLV